MNYLLSKLSEITIPPGQVEIPKGDLTSTQITDGLQAFFGIAAAVAVLVIALSAFRIVISRGNTQDVQKARNAIVYAAIGLVITMSGFVIVTFVIEGVS